MNALNPYAAAWTARETAASAKPFRLPMSWRVLVPLGWLCVLCIFIPAMIRLNGALPLVSCLRFAGVGFLATVLLLSTPKGRAASIQQLVSLSLFLIWTCAI